MQQFELLIGNGPRIREGHAIVLCEFLNTPLFVIAVYQPPIKALLLRDIGVGDVIKALISTRRWDQDNTPHERLLSSA